MSKQSYFKQFSLGHSLVLFDTEIGPYQVLPLQARVDLRMIAMKGYSTFISRTLISGVLAPSAEKQSVYSMGKQIICIRLEYLISHNHVQKKIS